MGYIAPTDGGNGTKIPMDLTGCMYKVYVGYSSIEFTVGQAYSGITLYYFYIGYI